MNLSGPPTRGDLEELLLRWVITRREEPDADDEEGNPPDDPSAVGNALASALVAFGGRAFLSNEALEAFVFARFKETWLVKIRRAIVSRGGDPQNRDGDDAADAWPTVESIALHKTTLPRNTASRLADAIADVEVSSTTAMWDWYAREEAERKKVASAEGVK